ncbi:MAG: DEAD/DEAH box helicase [Proteobacteria bacterium]|nr:DEAD/DEAH box helicase [Pseudomonadota bacterium]
MDDFRPFKLRPTTMAALTAMGVTTPTPIQSQALPPLLEERDVIGQARTGSGKTLAFAIPLIEFVSPRRREVQALVLTPTRELATQVGSVVEALGTPCGIRTVLAFGGRAISTQETALKRGAQVVVGAPGRVLDLINRGSLDVSKVHYFVLDEADEMLDRGFAPDVERILARLPKSRQTALFSATVPKWVLDTSTKHLVDPVRVQLDTAPREQPDIEHRAYELAGTGKLDALRRLLDTRSSGGSAIVFGRTKHGVKKLARQLVALGYPAAALQGNLSQNARDRVMADFRSGAVPILLATNVAARGIDVDHVDLVINYELPETAELLTHRVGRTGRMWRKGRAVTLLSPTDADKWRQLQRGLIKPIPRHPWDAEAVV